MIKGQLVVEGIDDKHVIWAYCEKYKLKETFKIVDTKGYDNLRDGLDERIKSGVYDYLGIVIDADTDIKSRWQSISDVLKEFGYLPPKVPTEEGTIIENPHDKSFYPLKIGVWIMPNNTIEGMLEDFLMIDLEKESLFHIAKESVEKVSKTIETTQRFKDSHYSKALIHTYLAWKEPPARPLGQAVSANFFKEDSTDLQSFINWLKNLFDA